ncbi:MAG: hypothetical protein NTZ92_03415 [Candidatus Omnitrophica bacterium]|nr:hypothetical protein [Candidatus Omnitrophota bacterium]
MVEETKQAEKPVVEIQTNCLGCSKPLKKIRRYYRDGKFYCIKRCWRTYLDKSKAEAGEKK